MPSCGLCGVGVEISTKHTYIKKKAISTEAILRFLWYFDPMFCIRLPLPFLCFLGSHSFLFLYSEWALRLTRHPSIDPTNGHAMVTRQTSEEAQVID